MRQQAPFFPSCSYSLIRIHFYHWNPRSTGDPPLPLPARGHGGSFEEDPEVESPEIAFRHLLHFGNSDTEGTGEKSFFFSPRERNRRVWANARFDTPRHKEMIRTLCSKKWYCIVGCWSCEPNWTDSFSFSLSGFLHSKVEVDCLTDMPEKKPAGFPSSHWTRGKKKWH